MSDGAIKAGDRVWCVIVEEKTPYLVSVAVASTYDGIYPVYRSPSEAVEAYCRECDATCAELRAQADAIEKESAK